MPSADSKKVMDKDVDMLLLRTVLYVPREAKS